MKRKEPCGTVRIKGRSWYTSHHILPVVHLCALSVKQKRVVLASHSHTFDLKVILAKNQTFRQKGVIWARLIWLSVHSNPMNTNYINYIEFSCHLTIRFDSSILLFFSDSIVSCSFSHITLLFSSFFTEGRYKCFMMSHLIFRPLKNNLTTLWAHLTKNCTVHRNAQCIPMGVFLKAFFWENNQGGRAGQTVNC